MIPIVISDIHSRWNKLLEVLRLAGVMEDGKRLPGYQLIQVGDAVSAGYGMKEADFYRDWAALLEPQDIELIGNHEAPVFWPYDDRFKFYGYVPGDMGTEGCDPELRVEMLVRRSHYKVAHVVNDWLVTHAGVMKQYQDETAEKTAAYLNAMWYEHMNNYNPHPWQKCPICCNKTGVMWVRDLEKTAKDPTQIKQVFGHTPDGPTLSKGGTMWNIDTPRIGTEWQTRNEAEAYGGVSCLKWNDAKQDWDPYYVP